jgi:hypothetical protein
MARYQLGGGWPVDQWLIPSGTLIDDVSGTDMWSMLIRERALPPPVNASPLTQETYDQMVKLYGAYRVGPPPEASR